MSEQAKQPDPETVEKMKAILRKVTPDDVARALAGLDVIRYFSNRQARAIGRPVASADYAAPIRASMN
jgi:hypothetical protein